ncbi:MAG: hypothetical protein PXZ07_00270 [Candidatus Eremiobacteraeota bacterium]|nr:hypothetical protein [Candidatus Eremiobacteraeota bacterium]
MRLSWRFSAFFTALALLGAAPQTAPLTAQRVTVPGGTQIAYRVVGSVSSANAKVGDTFPIRVVHNVVVDSWIVIARGATGKGEVISVDRAGPHGHAGSLKVRTDWIYGVDGNKIQLTDQDRTAHGRSEKGKASTLTVVSAVFLGIPGLFAHNFVRGKDVTIDRNHTYHAFVDQSVYVAASHRRMTASGFAPAAAATSTP